MDESTRKRKHSHRSSSKSSSKKSKHTHDNEGNDDGSDMKLQEARLIRLAAQKGVGDVRSQGRVLWADDVDAEQG